VKRNPGQASSSIPDFALLNPGYACSHSPNAGAAVHLVRAGYGAEEASEIAASGR
jgi:hypothetical protein